jgi:hypothetical protein
MRSPVQGKSLCRSTPEEQGVRSQDLLDFIDSLEAGQWAMHSLMLVRHGYVIAEGWWAPYDPGCKRYIYSLSKSFTSTAVGFAVKDGLLSVNDRVISFFPEDLPEHVGSNLAAMRVRDLLTMTSGHAIDTLLMVLPRGLENWAKSILTVAVDFPPGSHFLYNTGATYLVSCIVQKVVGQTVLDYLTRRLFDPLMISGMTWDTCPSGISTGGWGLNLKTEDLAKFGQFYLQKGSWNATQLLSPTWIKEATTGWVRNDLGERAKEPADWRQGYGYQFWRCQHGAYRADGAAGQYCVVMPEQDAVLVITSETKQMQGILDLTWQYLLPFMKDDPFPPQPEAHELLRDRLDSLQMIPPPAQSLPPSVEKISGKLFKVRDNDLGVQQISFTFKPDSCVFRLWDGAGEHRILCGNGTWVRNETCNPMMQPTMIWTLLNRKVEIPIKVAAYGQWKDTYSYAMTWQYLETPHSDTVTCHFKEKELRIEVASSASDPTNPFLASKGNILQGDIVLNAGCKEETPID